MPEIEGSVESVVFRNEENGYSVISLKASGGEVMCVGVLPSLVLGERLKIEGEWTLHRQYGRQLKISKCESVKPTSKSEVEKYLCSGIIKGIGESTAKLIVARFGRDALDILDDDPGRIKEIKGMGAKRAAKIIESYQLQRESRRTMFFLQSCGMSLNMANKVIQVFGKNALNVVRNDPYLLSDRIDGIGFKTADAIAVSQGLDKNSSHRVESAVMYVLDEASVSDGHVYLPESALISRAAELLSVDKSLVERSILSLTINMRLVRRKERVYLRRLYDAERDVASMLCGMLAENSQTQLKEAEALLASREEQCGIELSPEQRQAVLLSVTRRAAILTGGPGTGKTTCVNYILWILRHLEQDQQMTPTSGAGFSRKPRSGGEGVLEVRRADSDAGLHEKTSRALAGIVGIALGDVRLCAPTGRAAKRMQEATGEEAMTIHRLLEYSGENGGFARNEDNKLECDAVIVDEMSMVDIYLMRALLCALDDSARIIMVGDIDQLPSVGAGNVLRDMVKCAKVPVNVLTHIYRQAQQSYIVKNAHKINRGEMPVFNASETDCFFEAKSSASEAALSVVELVTSRLPSFLKLQSSKSIQVMAPMKKGECGVRAINALLQNALNPMRHGVTCVRLGEYELRLGDKVMQTKNNYEISWTRGDDEGMGVFNGDIGFVSRIDEPERTVEVLFDDERRVLYESDDLPQLELAYCMSVHKSQGSEFEVVVLPLVSGPRMLFTRNLLYTALTRAKKLAVIVGRKSCVGDMVNNDYISERYSSLDEAINEIMAINDIK